MRDVEQNLRVEGAETFKECGAECGGAESGEGRDCMHVYQLSLVRTDKADGKGGDRWGEKRKDVRASSSTTLCAATFPAPPECTIARANRPRARGDLIRSIVLHPPALYTVVLASARRYGGVGGETHLAEDGDASLIAPERLNVSLNPFERGDFFA